MNAEPRIGRTKHLSGRSDPARYPARQAAAVLESGRNSGSSASTTCLPWPEHSSTPRNPSTNPATPHLGTAPPSANRQLPCSRSIRLAQAPLTPSPAALSTAGHARARPSQLSPAREPGSARSPTSRAARPPCSPCPFRPASPRHASGGSARVPRGNASGLRAGAALAPPGGRCTGTAARAARAGAPRSPHPRAGRIHGPSPPVRSSGPRPPTA